MNWVIPALLLLGLASMGQGQEEPKKPAAAARKSIVLDFEKDEAGKAPKDFTVALTGGGPAPSFAVQKDAEGKGQVLAQTSADATDFRFPICAYDKWSGKDVRVTVHFKAIDGEVDQAAGLVARYADKDNYYITRANSLENNVRLYRIVKGERKQFAGQAVKVTAGEWHTLSLEVKGSHFKVALDGKQLFEADDATFPDAGKVGVWTKADSITWFDDLSIEPLAEEPPKN
jgi:hypothetical protein